MFGIFENGTLVEGGFFSDIAAHNTMVSEYVSEDSVGCSFAVYEQSESFPWLAWWDARDQIERYGCVYHPKQEAYFNPDGTLYADANGELTHATLALELTAALQSIASGSPKLLTAGGS